MKIVICGPFLTEKMEQLLPGASPAAGRFLRNMNNKLKDLGCNTISASFISVPIGDNSLEDLKSIADSANGIYIFKGKSPIKSVYSYRVSVLNEIDKDTFVIIYNPTYSTLGLAKKIKRKGGHPILMLADFTEPKEYKNLVRKLLAFLFRLEIRCFEKVIVLSENSKSMIKKKVPMLLMQGGIEHKTFKGFKKLKVNSSIIIMYSGHLSNITGVDIFLNMIKQNKRKDVEFVISGKGPLECDVKELTKYDSRVKFIGYLPDAEYYKILNSAHVLINPRNMEYPQNQNNFPSKVLEYLATGRPIISTKFPGYNLFEKNILFYDGSAEKLNLKIDDVCVNYEILSEKYYLQNRLFAESFDWKNQSKRIIDFIK